jgi:hypothetical protein
MVWRRVGDVSAGEFVGILIAAFIAVVLLVYLIRFGYNVIYRRPAAVEHRGDFAHAMKERGQRARGPVGI